jgi:hypothetical protein
LCGCAKSGSDTASQATPTPAASAAGDVASSPAAASGDPAQVELQRPTTSNVTPFDGASLIAAYAALPDGAANQADAVEFALLRARTNLECEAVRHDFTDDFAAHRNVARYSERLKAQARPMTLSSVDLQTSLGDYDFNGKHFAIGSNYGDGNTTFSFNYSNSCYISTSVMPDKSTLYRAVELEANNGNALHVFPVDATKAEALKNSAPQYNFIEHLVFFPVTIARRESGEVGAIVHVTKVELDERPISAPANAMPTVLMSTTLP